MSRRARGGAAPSLPARVSIREMRPSDVSQVMVIETATSATPWTRAMFLSELGRPPSPWPRSASRMQRLRMCQTSA